MGRGQTGMNVVDAPWRAGRARIGPTVGTTAHVWCDSCTVAPASLRRRRIALHPATDGWAVQLPRRSIGQYNCPTRLGSRNRHSRPCEEQEVPHPAHQIRPLSRESQALLRQELGKSVEHRLHSNVPVGHIPCPLLYTNLYIHGKTVVMVTPGTHKSSLFDGFRDRTLTSTPECGSLTPANGDLCRITSSAQG